MRHRDSLDCKFLQWPRHFLQSGFSTSIQHVSTQAHFDPAKPCSVCPTAVISALWRLRVIYCGTASAIGVWQGEKDGMDPNATYDQLVEAMASRNWASAVELSRHLWNWLAKGGFLPDRPQVHMRNMPDIYQYPEAAGLRPLLNGINRRLA